MMTGITKNPKGVWAFMEAQTLHNAASYQLMPTYSKNCVWDAVVNSTASCWQDLSTPSLNVSVMIGAARGIPVLHPHTDRAVLIRWKSPISGTIDVMGRISDVDNGGGDGVDWFVDYQNTTVLSGTVNGNGNTFFKQNISVIKGQSLYFIIDRGVNNDALYDSTSMDIMITSQQ
jgi:hypothetical protein